jgi:methylated-DNA-[protein]-cysteine S-methyltransferase
MITEFQKKVYEIVKKVPKGKTTTYKAIALKLNSSPRAIGQALKVNPYSYAARRCVGGQNSMPERVPCHRVIMSNGKIGGYSGSNPKNIKKKIQLLKEEGIKFL